MNAPSLDPPPDDAYPGFASSNKGRRSMIWVGTNHGILEGIDARTGVEVWGFIPLNLLPKLKTLRDGLPVGKFDFFVDGSAKISDVRVDGICDAAHPELCWRTHLIIGEGPGARSIRIDLPPFTLVGATTRSGLITRPLRERFGIPLRLLFYEPGELAKILTRGARLLALDLTPDGAAEIARRARGTPRVAMRLLRRIRDFAAVGGWASVDAATADKALLRLEVDHRGLDAMDRRYLRAIAEHYGGGPVGVETMAAALGDQRDVLEEVIEPYLLQQGFLQRTPRGRMLTEIAYRHLDLAVPAGLPGQLDLLRLEPDAE